MATVPGVAFRPSRSARFAFTSVNLSGGYFPGWGIPCSLIFHQIPIFLAIFLSTLPTPPPPTPPPPVAAAKVRPHIQWMYFPKLPMVSQASKDTAPESQPTKPSPPPGAAAKGLTFPGPQAIVSDPLEPTNNIQTLIQPALKNAPILSPPLALPNLVLLADAGLAPSAKPLPKTEKPTVPEEPKPAPAPTPPVPKTEPLPPVNLSSVVAAAPLPMQRAEAPGFIVSPPTPSPADVAKQEAKSEPAEPSVTSAGGSDVDTVVALTPIPTASDQSKIPAGEARGRFGIAPKPDLASTETEVPSAVAETSKSAVVGIETRNAGSAIGSANAVSSVGPANAAAGEPPASVSISFGPGPAVKKAPNSGMAVTASTTGSGSFAGITVTGGVGDGPETTSITPREATRTTPRRPLQTSYGVSVISTEASGGGLPSFGLFANHDIYTVYVDMRETETDSDPAWTLEVAVVQDPVTPGSTAHNIAGAQGLVLPFPATKRRPVFPSETVRRHLRQMVIVYGVINTQGKMEQMSVKLSPDPALNEPLLTALGEWVFRPATRNGTAFAVKVLVGIPLWLSDLVAPPRHVSISTTPPS